jgi:hypothetical protein
MSSLVYMNDYCSQTLFGSMQELTKACIKERSKIYLHGKSLSQKRDIPFIAENVSM